MASAKRLFSELITESAGNEGWFMSRKEGWGQKRENKKGSYQFLAAAMKPLTADPPHSLLIASSLVNLNLSSSLWPVHNNSVF